MRVTEGPDGTVYTFHQSWLNTYMNCPEQARLDTHAGHTDATAIGTALHWAAEGVLRHGWGLAEARRQAVLMFTDLVNEDAGVRFVQVKTPDTAIAYLSSCVDAWWHDVYPCLGAPVAIEHEFSVWLDDYDGIEVRLGGTIDYVDDNGIIWDWKTAGDADKYGRKAWEHKRWSIQPTVYTYAWHHLTDEYAPFVFAACLKGPQRKPAQFVTVERAEGHWEWLRKQIRTIIDQAHASPDGPWPLRDQHVLCSPKWCPVWDQCKGKHVDI